jgi:hypothetical protein
MEASATVDLSATTPASEATAALDQMAAALRPVAPLSPETPHDADRRLSELVSNAEWARRYMSGDIAAREEFQKLTALKASADTAGIIADATPQIMETTIGAES